MKHSLIIVSLGAGDPDLLNARTVNAMRKAEKLYLRTSRHPIAPWLESENISFSPLDHFYEIAENYDDLNHKIASFLIQQANDTQVVYAVQDAVSDSTVRTVFSLSSDPSMISIIPGTGIFDQYMSSSLSILKDSSIFVSSASDFLSCGYFDPNRTILITELDNPIQTGQIKILLSEVLEDEHMVYLIPGFRSPVCVPLYQLDRQTDIDHTSAVLIPGSSFFGRDRYVLKDLVDIMDILRSNEGCPWDRVQTHKSLCPYVVEEAWECVASVEQDNMDHLCEELGDLLFQVVFHASIGSSYDEFTLGDVISSVCRKMIRRHHHVFMNPDKTEKNDESATVSWERIKRAETGHTTLVSSLKDLTPGLPALKYAAKIFKKLNPVYDSESAPDIVLTDLIRLCEKIRKHPFTPDKSELGALLLLCTELCFCLNTDSEVLLHQTADHLLRNLTDDDKNQNRGATFPEYLTFEELRVYLKHVEGEKNNTCL